MTIEAFEIFLVATPGLEPELLAETREKGFQSAEQIAGGIRLTGTWRDVWRANLELRGAGRVLARIASFHAAHLAQLDKRARAVPWSKVLLPEIPVRVEASCRKSRIYHSGAAAQRIATAIREELGAPIDDAAGVTVMARIENDLVTISVDTSGELLHKRGSKQAMARAPMRETMAALLLRRCGYAGQEPVVDPMCGSGTFIIEAAEIALDLQAGRNRVFAFEQLAGFDASVCNTLRRSGKSGPLPFGFCGSDRDAGAIKAALANAKRAGVEAVTSFAQKLVSETAPPDGPPGLVICNPPYGTRIGDTRALRDLYASLGKTLRDRFGGWRAAIVTTDPQLARATGLRFPPPGKPILHGGLKVYLFQTKIGQ